MAYLVGLDLGTSSVKALLVDEAGHTAGVGSAEYPMLHPQPDRTEQQPEAWWRAAVVAVRQALSCLDDQQLSVSAIGLSGQMHGTVLTDSSGQPLAPAVIWPDRRSQQQVQEITRLIGAEHLIEMTGSPVATGFQAATLRWIQQEQPSLWRQVRHVLPPKDYLRWRLTGEMHTDPSDGSGTLLLDARTRHWSSDILAALGIDPELLPRVLPSLTVVGRLAHPAAVEMGLPEGTQVVVGAADTASSALGTGIVSPDTLLMTISTGGQIVLPATDVSVDPKGRIHTFCSAVEPAPGQAGWYQMAATLCAGMALRWLRDYVFNLPEPDAYSQMAAWAESAGLGARGLLFLPYLVGERSPHMDPTARGVFLGLRADHGRAELVRAVMEGVILACYDAYQVLTELGANPINLVMAGGGARSRLWERIAADVFNLPVRRLAIAEQSALGAALLAGAGIGLFDLLTAACSWATYDPPVEPDSRNHEDYLALFEMFRGTYRKHRSDFHRLLDYDR
jgi:xylulokinase